MNQTKNVARISNSKPASVLSRISAAQGGVVEHSGDRETTIVETTLPPPGLELARTADLPFPPAGEKLVEPIRLRIDPSTHPDFNDQKSIDGFLDSCIESAEQVQQLAQRLSESEDELRVREADLETRIEKWDQRVKSLEAEIELKLSQLQQQTSHVRCQQLNLMQLQTDIVKSHEASKKAIESLVVSSECDSKTIGAVGSTISLAAGNT